MSYSIHPITSPLKDAPGLAKAMMTAFYDDIHWRILWDSKPLSEIISDCTSRLPWNLINSRSIRRHLQAIDDETGEIVGYSRYILPETHEGIWLEAQTPKPSGEEVKLFEEMMRSVCTEGGRMRGMRYDIAGEFGGPLEEIEEGILKVEGECFAVDYMTVHPAHKGRRIASMMLKEALKYVDQVGLKAIVMASPAGKSLYERQGFELVRTSTQDDSKYGTTDLFVHHWLIRQPRKLE